MKPNLLYTLFLTACFFYLAGTKCFAFGTDTVKLHKTKPVIKQTPNLPHAFYSRESIKGYKPWFDNCTFTNQYTAAQRLKKYPFSKAAKIIAVSFNGDPEPNTPDTVTQDTLSYQEKQLLKGLTIIKDSLDYSTLYEIKTLNQDQIIHLSNVMYNAAYKKALVNTSVLRYTCYNPRNAFVFLNKRGKVIDYLEICFECKNCRSKYNKLSIGDYCTQKFDMLRQCFISAGIEHGTKLSRINH